MHHGQSRGKRNTHKVCKKHVGPKFNENRGSNNFSEIGGKFKFLVDD